MRNVLFKLRIRGLLIFFNIHFGTNSLNFSAHSSSLNNTKISLLKRSCSWFLKRSKREWTNDAKCYNNFKKICDTHENNIPLTWRRMHQFDYTIFNARHHFLTFDRPFIMITIIHFYYSILKKRERDEQQEGSFGIDNWNLTKTFCWILII